MNLGVKKNKLTKSKFNCSVIVSSCDSYEDLWKPFINTFNKNWGDCDLKKYFITENKELIDTEFLTIKCGLNKNWTDRLLYTLSTTDDDYIILMLEDFFLRSKIDNNKIHYFVNYIKKYNLNMIRLIKRPEGYHSNINHPELMEIKNNDLFRVSTQATIWNKEVLKNLLEKNENIWQFEINGTLRSKLFNNFFCVKKDVMTYRHHVVERGKWFPWYALYFGLINRVGIDLKKREIMNIFETIKWLANKLLSVPLSKLPIYLKRPIKYFAKKLKIYEN